MKKDDDKTQGSLAQPGQHRTAGRATGLFHHKKQSMAQGKHLGALTAPGDLASVSHGPRSSACFASDFQQILIATSHGKKTCFMNQTHFFPVRISTYPKHKKVNQAENITGYFPAQTSSRAVTDQYA